MDNLSRIFPMREPVTDPINVERLGRRLQPAAALPALHLPEEDHIHADCSLVIMSSKRMRITSNFSINAERLHEEVLYHDTGETKTVDHRTPHTSSHSTTITTNPVSIKTDGADKTKDTESHSLAANSATIGYDTSQL
ncbi:hypothetical protein LTR28_005066 [Elasticomyces elasticus]|nr:hypothetical protein LTR28_005066 [Elasticomyces elasticus]